MRQRLILALLLIALIGIAAATAWLSRVDGPQPTPAEGPRASPAPGPPDGSASAPLSKSTALEGRPVPSLVEQLGVIQGVLVQSDTSAFLERNASLARKYVERFCDEAHRLPGRRGLFSESERLRDASGWLVDRVDWEDGWGGPPKEGSLHLSQALLDKVNRSWPGGLGDIDLRGLDFTWMRELQAFDTWDVAAAGPLKERRGEYLSGAPLPHYILLLSWTKLRFAKALRDGDLFQAAAETRHLADLLHSQGLVVADRFAISVLQVERNARDVAAAQGRDVTGWAPLEADILLGQARLLDASPHFFYPGVDPEVMARALECAPAPCSALTEAALVYLHLGAFASSDTSAAFWSMAEERGCASGAREVLLSLRPAPSPSERGLDALGGRLEELFEPLPAR